MQQKPTGSPVGFSLFRTLGNCERATRRERKPEKQSGIDDEGEDIV